MKAEPFQWSVSAKLKGELCNVGQMRLRVQKATKQLPVVLRTVDVALRKRQP
jgi:hypothetical protein